MADRPPLRILQVGSALHDWSGIERYLVYLTGGLAARGHSVVATCPPGSALSQRLGVPTEPVGLKNRANLLAIIATARILRRHNIQILHAHYSPDFVMAGLAAKLARTPVTLLTRHVATHWSRTKIRRLLGLYQHIIPVSEATKASLEADGVPGNRMTVAYGGVAPLQANLGHDQARAKLGLEPERFWVGFVGRLVPEKGVNVLIDAFALLPPMYGLAIFGDGSEMAALRSRIDRGNLGDRVRLFGYVTDVADAMTAVDALALPSVWAEAFPFAVLEAMSVGTPVVASAVGGLGEQIRDGENGLLVPPNDPAALAVALRRCHEEPAAAARWGSNGQAGQLRDFTVERFVERVERVYLKLL